MQQGGNDVHRSGKVYRMSTTVLLIDGDAELGRLVEIVLQPIGAVVHQAHSGLEGLRTAYAIHPDLVILDDVLPEMDGFEVCHRLREMASMPILMLTACKDEGVMQHAFHVGADDFMQKPIRENELEARVRAMLRRANAKRGAPIIESYKDPVLEIDLAEHGVRLRGEPVKLSPREFALLAHLVRLQGKIANCAELMREVWGGVDINGGSTVALYIFYLRRKLQDGQYGHQYIRTNWGRGYWFETRREKEMVIIR